MWIALVLFLSISFNNVVSQKPKCPDGWVYIDCRCYSGSWDYDYIEDAQRDCKSKNSHVMIINDLDELEGLITEDVMAPGDEFMPGIYGHDNGTTWTYYDYSQKSIHFKALKVEVGIPIATPAPIGIPIGPPGIIVPVGPPGIIGPIGPPAPPPEIDHLSCRVSGPMHIRCRPAWSDYEDYYQCERGEIPYPEPCSSHLHKKLRRDATRKITWMNDKPKACYIEIKSKRFRPAQLKIYGYNFMSMNPDECDTGFMIQMNGDPIEDELKARKLTCGDKIGFGNTVMKRQTGRGGMIRLYFLMNGYGNKVWIRLKAQSILRNNN